MLLTQHIDHAQSVLMAHIVIVKALTAQQGKLGELQAADELRKPLASAAPVVELYRKQAPGAAPGRCGGHLPPVADDVKVREIKGQP